MKKGSKIFIIVILFLIVIATLAYFFYPQILELFHKNGQDTEEQELEEVEEQDKSIEAVRKVVLNGKEQSLRFEYVYDQKTRNATDYDVKQGKDKQVFNDVKAKLYLDDVYLGEAYLYDNSYYLDEFDNPIEKAITLEDTKNYMKNEFILEDVVDYKIIKGKNKSGEIEEYLYIRILYNDGYLILIHEEASLSYLHFPFIINDKGKKLFEIEGAERKINIPEFPMSSEDKEKYGEGKIYFYEQDGLTKIEHIVVEYTDEEESWHNHKFYIRTLYLFEGEIKEEKRILEKYE